MNRISRIAFTASLAALVAGAALAQVPAPVDLSGHWSLSATGLLPGQNLPCVFEGSGFMTQSGGQLQGHATLMLVQGPAVCPAEMMAQLSGVLDGLTFFGTLNGGDMFGMLDFQGRVGPDGRSLMGSFTVRSGGPFSGTTGEWSSNLLAIFRIPTLSGIGLALLALLILVASFLVLRRRQTA